MRARGGEPRNEGQEGRRIREVEETGEEGFGGISPPYMRVR